MFWKIYSSFLRITDPIWRWVTRNGYLIAGICWAGLALLAYIKSDDGSLVEPISFGAASVVGFICHIWSRRGRCD
ncbi:hypothetical protein [Acetobacteroides hydrogenigenes]|uniref:Uncharacterized protein n=1 Tax=Acetobacteroides hydrogenigenes TaxID=979970 RepID=A0A4R2E8A1_9BACT|nr:hypothetical protein [Acetobacteroides hydrogenigenes]TCN63066.1 hypothetical protein CLV25_11644 [Acetobacteroides hydrogenigenes]